MAKLLAFVVVLVVLTVTSHASLEDCKGGCGFYQVCNHETGKCVCPEECEFVEKGELCTTKNQTFKNECEFHKYVCKLLLESQTARIPHKDYSGPCQEVHPCTSDKFDDFPSRLTEWLEIILKEEETGAFERPHPSDRCELWSLANDTIVKKFVDLDDNGNNMLESLEVHGIRKQLIGVEVCARKFFQACAGKDKIISLDEWKYCLKLPFEPECGCPGGRPCPSEETATNTEETLTEEVDALLEEAEKLTDDEVLNEEIKKQFDKVKPNKKQRAV